MAQNFNLGTLGQVVSVNTAANTVSVNSSIVIGNSSSNVVINSTSVYVGGAPLGGSTNTDSQFTWTNTQTFSNTITFNSTIVGTVNNANYLNGNSASDLRTYSDNKASNAYSNAVSYVDTSIGTVNTAITSNASAAYTNATSYADTKAGTAYSNATSYADTKAATAYSNATSYADTKAATAYTNATSYVDGKSYVNTSQLSSNLNNYAALTGATFTGAVTVSNNFTVTGNLTLSGNTVIVGANNLIVQDAVISLHSLANLAPWTSNDGKLIGTAYHYYNSTDSQALLALDPSTTRLNFWANSTDAKSGDPSGTTYGTIQAAGFWAGNNSVYSTVNSSVYTGTSNNSTYAFGKSESGLNVNNALTSNNSSYLNTKTEANLNVNNALTANASTYLNGKTESNLNVNNALTANSASYLGSTAAAGYQTTAGLSANVATLAANSSTYANSSVTNTFTVGTSSYFVSNGNLGIGTSSPWEKLSIPFNSGLAFGSSTYSYKISRSITGELVTTFSDTYDSSTARVDFTMRNGAVTPLSLLGSGNVGIGTSSPAYKLDINGTTRFGATGAAVLAGVGGAFAGGQGELYTISTNSMGIGTTGAAAFKMYTNSVEAARIDSSGNMGIGTASPSQKLTVSGSGIVSSTLTVGQSAIGDSVLQVYSSYGGLRIGYNSTNVNYYDADTQIFRNTAGTERVRIASDGLTTTNALAAIGSSGMPSSVSGNAVWVGGFASPTSGRILIGDGTGWQFYLSSRNTGTTTDRFTFGDTGNFKASNSVWAADRLYAGGNQNYININYDQIWRPDGGTLHLQYNAAGNIHMCQGGGFAFSATSLRAPIFYDYNDTGYYIDPASTSTSVQVAGAIEIGNNFAFPNIEWAASGTSTGEVIFYLPGNINNYGMVHMVFDIYEYNSPRMCTVIIGGHNWSSAWYNYACNVVGYTDKQIRLGIKDNRFCVVFGTTGSSWSYGQIRLRKIHNGSYYNNIMDLGGNWATTQTTTESFTTITADLRNLRTPADFIADGNIYAAGNVTAYYSDERLKTKIGNIENPISIVQSIETFKYKNNDIAKANGFVSDEVQVGLSAQSVEKVLPEIIKHAPFDRELIDGKIISKTGEWYKTVQYDKLVPVLIEGMKEQQKTIEKQQNQIENLLARIDKLENK